MMKTKGGWSAEWKHGTKGTNLSRTKDQASTWFLWGYNPRGGQSILASVHKMGDGKWLLRNDMQGGKMMSAYGGHTGLARAKKDAESLVGIRR